MIEVFDEAVRRCSRIVDRLGGKVVAAARHAGGSQSRDPGVGRVGAEEIFGFGDQGLPFGSTVCVTR